MYTNTSVPTKAGAHGTEPSVLVPGVSAFESSVLATETGGLTAEASALLAKASALSAEASTLLAEATLSAEASLSADANSLESEAATPATSLLGGHAPTMASTNSTIPITFPAQREAPTESLTNLTTSTFTSTGFSTSIFTTDGHTTTSVTAVITTGVTTFPVSTNGASSSGPKSKTDTGGIIGGVIAAVAALVAITLVFYRLHRRKKISVERKMSEFGSDYPPRPEPFLVTSLPRPLNSAETRPSQIFSVALSADLSSNPSVPGSTHQSASIVAATAGENTDFDDDEKADLTILGQCISSHSVPVNTAESRRSSTLFSADSDPPPSYRASAIDFTLMPRDS